MKMNRVELKRAQKLFLVKYNAELNALTDEFHYLLTLEQDEKFYVNTLNFKNRLNFVRSRIKKVRDGIVKAQNMVA